MKIPVGMTEEEVTNLILEIVQRFTKKFKFGYYEEDDIRQEGFVLAMEALENYDGARPLENFLHIHLRNRFINLKRQKYSRFETPCISCPFYDPKCLKSKNQCAEFTEKMDCEKWSQWKKRNESKMGLMSPVDIEDIPDDNKLVDMGMFEDIAHSEIMQKIDRLLPMNLRGDFLRMLHGQKIPKLRQEAVQKAIKDMGVLEIPNE